MIVLFASCKKEEEKHACFHTHSVAVNEICKGVLDGNGDEGIAQANMVISDTESWQHLMDKMNTVNHVTDDFSETEIDFNQNMVIAVFLEVKGSGWEVHIEKVVEHEDYITVSCSEEASASAVMSQPFHIIKIPKTCKSIVFEYGTHGF